MLQFMLDSSKAIEEERKERRWKHKESRKEEEENERIVDKFTMLVDLLLNSSRTCTNKEISR